MCLLRNSYNIIKSQLLLVCDTEYKQPMKQFQSDLFVCILDTLDCSLFCINCWSSRKGLEIGASYAKKMIGKMKHNNTALFLFTILFLVISTSAWVLRFNTEGQNDNSDGKYKLNPNGS